MNKNKALDRAKELISQYRLMTGYSENQANDWGIIRDIMTDLSHYVFENANTLGADVPELIEVVQDTFNEENNREEDSCDSSQPKTFMKDDFFSYASETYHDVDDYYNESF